MDQPISDFFETTDFAQAVTLTTSSGSSTIYVIFDNEFILSNALGINYENGAPQVICKTSDVSGATNNGTITIDAVNYFITGVEPDGTGISRLILSKNSNTN